MSNHLAASPPVNPVVTNLSGVLGGGSTGALYSGSTFTPLVHQTLGKIWRAHFTFNTAVQSGLSVIFSFYYGSIAAERLLGTVFNPPGNGLFDVDFDVQVQGTTSSPVIVVGPEITGGQPVAANVAADLSADSQIVVTATLQADAVSTDFVAVGPMYLETLNTFDVGPTH